MESETRVFLSVFALFITSASSGAPEEEDVVSQEGLRAAGEDDEGIEEVG